MKKKIKVKELLEQVSFKEIFEYIGKFTGVFYYESFISAANTYDALINKDNLPVNPAVSAKYTLERKVALYKKLPADFKRPEDAVAATFYGLFTDSGKSYSICPRYVKNVADFSECEIIINDYETPQECAAILVLSFSVLHEKLREVYGDISSVNYIYYLKNHPSGEDEEE